MVFVLIFILLLLYRLFRRFSKYKALNNLAHGTAQLGIRASMALMIVFIVLSQTLGVQVILGTFLAGILVGLVNDQGKTDIFNKLDAIGFGFLIPIFFIMVGVQFTIRSLLTDSKALLLLPLLFVSTYLFKGLPLLLLRLKYPWRLTLSGAALLTTQMSVTVAAAAVGLKIGAISPGVDTAIILVAMLTSVISPVMFGKLLPSRMPTNEKYVVIVGNSPGAQLLIDQLKEKKRLFRWMRDKNSVLSWILRQEHVDTSVDVEELDIELESVRALVAYTNDDDANIEIATASAELGIPSVTCIIHDLKQFQGHSSNASFVAVNPQFAVITLIDQVMNYPISTQLLEAPGSLQIQEVRISSRALHGMRLMDMHFPGRLLVMSILREGTQIVPNGQTELRVGDTVVVVGDKDHVAEFIRMAITSR